MSRRSTLSLPVVVAVSVLALVLGSVGTAVAGPALTKAKVKSIATKIVMKKAPTLSVAHAATADSATTAGRADTLDGIDSSGFVQTCARSTVVATATWYAPSVPTGDVYVAPNRFGGEDESVCGTGTLQLTKLSTGNFRMQTSGTPFPATGVYVAMVNADSRTSTVLAGFATSKLAGPTWDIHVTTLAGAATDPYYLDVTLVRQH